MPAVLCVIVQDNESFMGCIEYLLTLHCFFLSAIVASVAGCLYGQSFTAPMLMRYSIQAAPTAFSHFPSALISSYRLWAADFCLLHVISFPAFGLSVIPLL